MDSFTQFEHPLPDFDEFWDELKEEAISNEDYEHVTELWDTFNLQNLGDLHDLYVISDVLLLTDTFEKYRKLCYSTYGLDPLHYYTLPGFSYDACLKYTKAKLEYIKDMDMLQMFECGIRGGIFI